jgi:murein DD-endopeptidase MepM/ murein hydrolase activator NlpD
MKYSMMRRNKKSQVFIVGVVLLITFGLVAAYASIHYLYSEKSKDESLGTYQSAMVDAIVEGDKALIYQQNAAKYAANDALKDFIDNGGMNIYADSGEDITGAKCGRYIYNLWDSETRDCFPTFKSSFSYYMSESLREQLGTTPGRNFQKNILMDYTFKPGFEKTTVYALATDSYDFYLFKSPEYKDDDNLQKYLTGKNMYVGTFIWPVPNNYDVSSCFGFRGIDYGTKYHGGLDIPASRGTSVVASAPGVVSDVKYPAWGRVEINHGQGIKTEYLHMDTIDPAIRIGVSVVQGQKVGTVGGRGKNSANEYNNHLHFSVIDDNVNARLANSNIPNAPAVIDGYWGKFVNPACFLDKDFLRNNNININFNQQSLSCRATCGLNGEGCSPCSQNGQGCQLYPDITQQAYKFCDLYTSLLNNKPGCQLNENDDWRITNLQVNPASVSGNQKVSIVLSIENDGDECATIIPWVEIIDTRTGNKVSNNDNMIFSSGQTDIYKKSPTKPYVNTLPVECTFTTDAATANTERQAGRCVLQAPSDGTTITYQFKPRAKDVKGREVDSEEPIISIAVTKPLGNPNQGGPTVPLSPQDKITFDLTRKRLTEGRLSDGRTWMEYIEQAAQQNGIPKEIMLGKITQESAAVNHNINIPSNYAVGIVQVEGRWHYDTIADTCGNTYIQECNNQYQTCRYTRFHDDIKCQVDTAVSILKDYYNRYSKDSRYENAVKSVCTNPQYQPMYLGYKGWERALRAYNGFGCTALTSQYVTHVMKWANAWGYGNYADYVAQSQDMIDKGVIGVYKINPSFTTTIGFDSQLFDSLVRYMKEASNSCKSGNINRSQCMDDNIRRFNNEISSSYVAKGNMVSLTRDCESTPEEKKVNTFVQSIEECKASASYDCQCPIERSDTDMNIEIDSNEQYSVMTYKYSIWGKEPYEALTESKFYDDGNNLWKGRIINIKSVSVYKERDGFKFKSIPGPVCQTIKNRFKMCLKTDYKATTYENGKLSSENLVLKYAITLRDGEAPDVVQGLELKNKEHDGNATMVIWNRNSEVDVTGYIIYLGNNQNDFRNIPTKTLKTRIPYRTLDILNRGVAKYADIRYDQEPTCRVVDNNGEKYCTFEYNAITAAANGRQATKISLEKNKVYFIEDRNKYLYVLDGNDPYNKMKIGIDKFVAVTAYDLDGNEINNTVGGKFIVYNQNMKSIRPQNLIEPGLVNNVNYQIRVISNTNKQLILSWDALALQIEGSELTTSTGLTYNARILNTPCADNALAAYPQVMLPLQTYTTTSNNALNILSFVPGSYCLIVTSKQNGKEYSQGIARSLVIT